MHGQRNIKLTISGIANRLHYCVEFMLYAQFTNLAAGRRLETRDLRARGINEPEGVLGIKFQSLMQMTGVTFLNEISVHPARRRKFFKQMRFSAFVLVF